MRLVVLIALLALVALAPRVEAQPAVAPSIIAAEQTFDRGLRAFRAGDFGAAHSAFQRVIREYDFNQRTTAAHLMSGKALFAGGDAEGAISEMTAFIAAFPRSRYVADARDLRRSAMDYQREDAPGIDVIDLGVLLPLASQDAVFSQALFNGIRLAVDDHNSDHPGRPSRLVFRDSGGDAATASAAAQGLVRQGVRMMVGPLYSEEAIAAGAVAEREGVVLLSPLATDQRVSEGRRNVFQANPTFDVRGRAMARYADEQRLNRVGIVSVRGSFGETMAQAFMDEAVRRGIDVVFAESLPSGEAWFQLAERIGAERFLEVDAVYFPVAGSTADEQAAASLRGLESAVGTEATRPLVLGNTEWQNLRASRPRAERFGTVFTNDFHLGESTQSRSRFESRYHDLAGIPADRLAFMGYDLTSKLIEALGASGIPSDLAARIRNSQRFDGLAHQIDFGGGQVNQSLFLMRFSGDRMVLVR